MLRATLTASAEPSKVFEIIELEDGHIHARGPSALLCTQLWARRKIGRTSASKVASATVCHVDAGWPLAWPTRVLLAFA